LLHFLSEITELRSKYKVIRCSEVNIALLGSLILQAIDPKYHA